MKGLIRNIRNLVEFAVVFAILLGGLWCFLEAQVSLTAHMLFGFALKRKDGWKQIRYQVEA